jgi:prepilin-type N-terminal cleavage/methylation domain-containing protein
MRNDRAAMTLVELLVVIAIVGVLIAMLLPAVQAAREVARRAECANHLKQLGLASLLHEQTQGFFPSGGWGCAWIGDPDLGFGPSQPGGWAYSVLPYLEQSPAYDLGRGQDPPAKKQAAIELARTALAVFYCPSRRAARCYPHDPVSSPPLNPGVANLRVLPAELPVVAKSCYCANGGSVYLGIQSLPATLEDARGGTNWIDTSSCNGIVHQRSRTRVVDVSDGTSNTYWLGEKNVDPERYETYSRPGDSQSMFNGHDQDNTRYAGINVLFNRAREYALIRDTRGESHHECFGGAHPGACLFAFCDGSVRPIGYSIASAVHGAMAARNDGTAVNPDDLR